MWQRIQLEFMPDQEHRRNERYALVAPSTRQFLFAAPAAAVYSAVPLAGIVQK